MRQETHHVDFCVVGGGLAGMCAAIAAARHGAKVALIQDRPVLGGNCSSEIRMHICGARGVDHDVPNVLETGIIEEILLENRYRNPRGNYSIWDSILYGKVAQEENIQLLLNCSVADIQMDKNRIVAVKGWQLTTYTWHTVHAKLFADCSGDSILSALAGAEVRVGRESSEEFGEDIAPDTADRKTMGLSCLIQARQTDKPVAYTPPGWANTYPTEESLESRDHDLPGQNFWWIELGGDRDSIHDAEDLRDELLKVAFGVWDHVKNYCENKEQTANWALEWVGFLPGKRESRRYVGDYILTQNDIRSRTRFEDVVAYGGWPMDDHHPAGLNHKGKPTIWHPAPTPYGIPYRCLYSQNIDNLFCAGRNISATHTALSSTRVMATCAVMGQAVGTAAAIGSHCRLSPREVYKKQLELLQQVLMDDDCYLPWQCLDTPAIVETAVLTSGCGDPASLNNGIDRPVADADNGWLGKPGDWLQYEFPQRTRIRRTRIVFDSDLNRVGTNMPAHYALDQKPMTVPESLVKSFAIEARNDAGGWEVVHQQDNNYQRLVTISLDVETDALRLVLKTTWGAKEVHLFAWDVSDKTSKLAAVSKQRVSTDSIKAILQDAQQADESVPLA